MLKLTRRINEYVILKIPPSTNEQIVKIHMLDVKHFGGRVFPQCVLGIEADGNIAISRSEIVDKLTRINQEKKGD